MLMHYCNRTETYKLFLCVSSVMSDHLPAALFLEDASQKISQICDVQLNTYFLVSFCVFSCR